MVNLSIYNMNGLLVEILVNGNQCAGKHSISWNACEAKGNSYYYVLKVDNKTKTKKMLLVK